MAIKSCSYSKKDNTMTIVIECNSTLTVSPSGKTKSVFSTHGNQAVPVTGDKCDLTPNGTVTIGANGYISNK